MLSSDEPEAVRRSPLSADAGKSATGLRSPATDAQVPAETPPICHRAEAGADVDIVNITVIGIGELDLQMSRLSASYHGTFWGTTPLCPGATQHNLPRTSLRYPAFA
jgi:hypothetical protein